MKIIIIEFVHYQYALTLTELFKGNEIVYVFSEKIKKSLKTFAPDFKPTEVWVYDNTILEDNVDDLIEQINSSGADLLCIDPIFDNFKPFAKLAKKVKIKKIITTHNINTWFRPTLRFIGSLKEKIYKRQIIENSDYIAVEDFIYQYIKEKEPKLFLKYNFIYVPYTIYHPNKNNKIKRNDGKIKIVLPGSIDYERRRYEITIEAIYKLFKIDSNFIFSFAGPARGEYGKKILLELKKIEKKFNDNIIIFDQAPKPEEFRFEMESADIILSTSTKYFKGLGTVEEIGKTKPTAAIHDMITFVLPGILPQHLNIPKGLASSSISYDNSDELVDILLNLKTNNKIKEIQKKAEINSTNFSAEKIIERNPFSFIKS